MIFLQNPCIWCDNKKWYCLYESIINTNWKIQQYTAIRFAVVSLAIWLTIITTWIIQKETFFLKNPVNFWLNKKKCLEKKSKPFSLSSKACIIFMVIFSLLFIFTRMTHSLIHNNFQVVNSSLSLLFTCLSLLVETKVICLCISISLIRRITVAEKP